MALDDSKMKTNSLLSMNTKPAPFMENFEKISILHALNSIKGKKSVLEWGSGGSTLYFSSLLEDGSEWISIEHDKEWHRAIDKRINSENNKSIRIVYSPPSSAWSSSQGDGTFNQFRDYVLEPIKFNKIFDFIIVDGRARPACMNVGWEMLSDNGIMILHDAQREIYIKSIPKNSYTLRITNTKINIDGNISTLLLSKSSTKINLLSIELRNALPDYILVIKNGVNISENMLYAGDIPEHKNYTDWIGLSLTKNNNNHIRHDITSRLPIEDNTIDYYQSEDVFEHIDFKHISLIINDIFRVLKIGGVLRISIPDYGCDILRKRSIIDADNNIIFDKEGGGNIDNPGHVWFPRIDTIKEILSASLFNKYGNINYLHYYNMDSTFVVNKIDYSRSTVTRTPDHDPRVMSPYRPMSIVVDLTKSLEKQ